MSSALRTGGSEALERDFARTAPWRLSGAPCRFRGRFRGFVVAVMLAQVATLAAASAAPTQSNPATTTQPVAAPHPLAAAPAHPSNPAAPVGPPTVPPPAAGDVVPPAVEPSPGSTPVVSRFPPPPEDPRLAQVYAIFNASCTRCHQTGKLTRPSAAAGLANILDLERLAREPHLVHRGLPDASRLYQVLLDRHRPVDLGTDPGWPDAESVQRVRTWVEELETRTSSCAVIGDAEVARSIDAAVRAAGYSEGRDLRFVSLVHLANSCATPAEMEAYRQGVAKLLNSLSWGSRPIVPVALGAANALLAFKLSDIGWIDDHWTALSRAEPKGIARDLSSLVTAPGANPRAIRGDWLAWAASQPPFYAELLGIPPTIEETAKLLGIRLDSDPAALRNTRAAVKSSAITRGPRVIERRSVEGRTLWSATDTADNYGDHDVFERPLGGVAGAPEAFQFRPEGRRLMFTLPNGLLAFALTSPDGRRIDQLPPRLDAQQARVVGTSGAGLACLGCHSAGPKPFLDAMRTHLASDKFVGPRDVRDMALSIYPSNNEWAPILDDDGYRYRRALIQAGLDPDLTIDGLDPLAALARRYVLPVDFAVVAAEAGLSAAEFEAKLASVSLPDPSLAPRLRQGTLPRAIANLVLAQVNPIGDASQQAGVAAPQPPTETALNLALWTDRATYKAGDLVTIYAQASAPCHLTLISLTTTGKATVLYPNEFDPDNLIAPDAPARVPAPTAQYQFRFKDKGRETVIASCQLLAQYPPGIEPDYEHQRFTSLGNYENFLHGSFAQDTDAQRLASRANAEKARAARLIASKDNKPDHVKPDSRNEETARAAVRVQIE